MRYILQWIWVRGLYVKPPDDEYHPIMCLNENTNLSVSRRR